MAEKAEKVSARVWRQSHTTFTTKKEEVVISIFENTIILIFRISLLETTLINILKYQNVLGILLL